MRYRPEPLCIEVVSIGRERTDGPVLLLRVPSMIAGKDETRDVVLYMATRLDEITIPQPFASEAQIIALGFAPEPLRAVTLPDRAWPPNDDNFRGRIRAMAAKTERIKVEVTDSTEGETRTFKIVLTAPNSDFQLADLLRQRGVISSIDGELKQAVKVATQNYLAGAEERLSRH